MSKSQSQPGREPAKGEDRTAEADRLVVLGIAGSLRAGSLNRALLGATRDLLPQDARLQLYPGLGEIPPYNQDEDRSPAPRPVDELRRSIEKADAVLFASPEYNQSIPGVLKNAVDWASRPHRQSCLAEKPVAVIGASPGRYGAAWAGEELRKVLRACSAKVLDHELAVGNAPDRFDTAGRLTDADVRQELRQVVRKLVDLVAGRGPQEGDRKAEAEVAMEEAD